jgi:RNA polymerase sigma-70 factor (ECF subfamily)
VAASSPPILAAVVSCTLPWAEWGPSVRGAAAEARTSVRMDWKERADATEAKLRGLLLLALAGDAVAYRQFLAALGAHLRAFYRRRLAALPDNVEDLVQETLLAVHTHRHTYEPGLPLTSWIHTIARYKLVDFLRSHARRDALNDPLDDELEVFAGSDLDASEARRDLEKILQSLPERQRRAVVMTKLEGASVAETARATGQSESAVKASVHRGLKLLAAKARGGT